MRLSVLLAGLVCGCGGAPVASRHIDLEPPPIIEPLLAPVVLSIAHPAASYNEPYAAPESTPLADAVRAAMQDAVDTRGEITRDPRLDVVCREIATVVSRDAAPSAALVEFVLRSHGVAEQAAHVFVAWTEPTPTEVITAMRPQFGESLVGRMRTGIGTVSRGTKVGPTIAIVVRATGVDLGAVPRSVAARGKLDLTATLDPRVESPQVIITHDDGSIERPALMMANDGRTWHAPFACGEHIGRQWVEIDAEGLGGVLPRVLVPILCGSTWPSSFAIEPAANLTRLTSSHEIERRLTSIINRQRVRAGLPMLRSDARITDSARRRSASLGDARAAGDAAANTSSPIERLRASGMAPLGVLESVLEVDSVGQAAEELMNNASYRLQLESPDTTHVGVGVDGDLHAHLFITITYAQFPPPIDAPAVASCIADAMEGVGSSHADTELSKVAQRYAEGLASGATHAQLWPGILAELTTAARNRYKKISYATARAIDVVQIDPGDLVRGQRIDDIGVGVGQSARDGSQGGVSWVVVFLAERHRPQRRFDVVSDPATRRACLAAASGRSPRSSSANRNWTFERRGVAVPSQ